MAEIRNCVTPVVTADNTTIECCRPCQSDEMHDNCRCEGCCPISVSCDAADINAAICLPILAEQVFDRISIRKEELGSLSDLTFKLDNDNPNYHQDQPVCIKKIGISYNLIGLEESKPINLEVIVNGQTFTLKPASLYNASTVVGTTVNIFNELEGPITLQPPCCCEPQTKPGTKLRIIEKSRAFQVSGLRIVVSGVIGCIPFTATADTASLVTTGTNLIPLSKLDISDMTFIGKICWPHNKTRMLLEENFDTKLNVDCIIPTTNYNEVAGTPGNFKANIDLSFVAKKKIYVINKGVIAVFTTPDATLLRNGEIIE